MVEVLELRAKGYSIPETAIQANISQWKARQILDRINTEAREGLLSSMISDRVPLALEQSLELNRIIIRKALLIASSKVDARCKLEALRLAKDTNQASNQILADSAIIAKAVQRSAISMPINKQTKAIVAPNDTSEKQGIPNSPQQPSEELNRDGNND